MAEFIFKNLVAQRGLQNEFLIQSSATSSEEIWGEVGNPVYPPARECLKKHGIDCGNKTAVQLKKSDYDKYDLFLLMDDRNVRNVGKIFGSDPQKKVHKLLEFANSNADVADPWYTRDFDVAYDDILKGCKALLDVLI